jgi:hypothetical protein
MAQGNERSGAGESEDRATEQVLGALESDVAEILRRHLGTFDVEIDRDDVLRAFFLEALAQCASDAARRTCHDCALGAEPPGRVARH